MLGFPGVTDVSTFSQVVSESSLAKAEIARLSAETSSGLVSQTYSGLGQGGPSALDLSQQVAAAGAVAANADNAANVMQVSQTALGQIASIASSFAAQLTSLGSGTASVGVVSASAQDALRQVATLLNTEVGGRYVFAGQDSANPPVPDPDQVTSSAFFTAIQAAVGNLGASGAATVAAQTLAIASPGGVSPFSPTLTAATRPAEVDLGQGQREQVGLLADRNSDAVSTGAGTTSTGSWMRDLMRGLATIGSLSGSQATDPQFLPLVQDTITSVQGAIVAMNTDIGVLGTRQDTVTQAKTLAGSVGDALKAQLSSLTDADVTEVATELSAAQTRLQASYQIIGSLQNLSLVKFLPAS
jgi:flagellin-like hook-associated protein FlgL